MPDRSLVHREPTLNANVLLWLTSLFVPDAGAQEVRTGGEIRSTLRLGIHDCLDAPTGCPWLDFRDSAIFEPWVEVRPHPQLQARGSVSIHLRSLSDPSTIEELSDPDLVQFGSLRIHDAWVGTRGEHLDLRIGADRIPWGVADGFSLADRFNPLDLTDPTRFDQRLSTPLALIRLHTRSVQFEVIGAPFFQPAALPSTSIDLTASADRLFDSESTGAGDIVLGTMESRLSTPEPGLGSTTWGTRLRWSAALADLALSWTSGPDPLPQVDGDISLIGFQTDQDRIDLSIPLRFPILHSGALELRTDLPGDTAAWTEVAVYLPERTVARTSEWQLQALLELGTITEIPEPLPTTVTQDGQAYMKWIAGMARHFGPVYLQVQWLRGFPTERQASELTDYLVAGCRWSISPTIKLEVGGVSDLTAIMSTTELAWLFRDSAEFHLGVAWTGGETTSSLMAFAPVSHIRTGVALAF